VSYLPGVISQQLPLSGPLLKVRDIASCASKGIGDIQWLGQESSLSAVVYQVRGHRGKLPIRKSEALVGSLRSTAKRLGGAGNQSPSPSARIQYLLVAWSNNTGWLPSFQVNG
jgi:hypothetical protein